MTRVKDFIHDHVRSKDVIVIGLSPSTRKVVKKLHTNSTLPRLDRWMKEAGQKEWSFHNVIPNIPGSSSMRDVDERALRRATKGKSVIIALGSFVERVCKKYDIDAFKIDHPSPRNRNFNDPSYEPQMISRLREYLKNKSNKL